MLIRVFPILRSHLSNHIKGVTRRFFSQSTRLFKQEMENDDPIKFSTSPAYKYRAKTSRTGSSESRLWYEEYVILASIAVFLIYFTILREENDIDYELSRTLYSRIDGLEEFQLKQVLEYNQTHNKDTTDIVKRLKEIEAEKQRLSSQ